MLVACAGNVGIRMAILAAVSRNMDDMTEQGAAGTENYLFDRMAFLTVGFYAESGLRIVAGAAGESLFHLRHADPYTVFTCLENTAVALGTFVHALVNGMTEGRGAGFLDLENNIYGGSVTRVTITFYAEHRRTVVAAAAGRTFLHLGH